MQDNVPSHTASDRASLKERIHEFMETHHQMVERFFDACETEENPLSPAQQQACRDASIAIQNGLSGLLHSNPQDEVLKDYSRFLDERLKHNQRILNNSGSCSRTLSMNLAHTLHAVLRFVDSKLEKIAKQEIAKQEILKQEIPEQERNNTALELGLKAMREPMIQHAFSRHSSDGVVTNVTVVGPKTATLNR